MNPAAQNEGVLFFIYPLPVYHLRLFLLQTYQLYKSPQPSLTPC